MRTFAFYFYSLNAATEHRALSPTLPSFFINQNLCLTRAIYRSRFYKTNKKQQILTFYQFFQYLTGTLGDLVMWCPVDPARMMRRMVIKRLLPSRSAINLAVLVLLLVAVVALAAAGSGHKEGKGHHKGKKEVKEARTLEAKRPDAKEAKKCHGK
ncbi:uncharacterized protein LOC113209320 isoform X1 [Frankliniella occidentalis]|uniref:Uncharacterized protein LOC113209320 isoform X1 n=1 Tax=Frankliniella occidentalis TaxID=133901 RepID=A0A9C6WUF5_FRAOC|nr:uncharacterized protein LOC113209320 isoform X1 [Frankliniella occidentalis]